MNLLPFTMIFVLIISLSTLAFFQGHMTTTLSSCAFSGFMQAHVEARNQVEKNQFASHPPPPSTSTEKEQKKEPTPRDQKEYDSFRHGISDNSKFNIAPLIKNHSLLLQQTLVHLIFELYGETALFKDSTNSKLSELLVREIIKAASQIPLESLELANIILSDPDLNTLWYKMLRGTPEYNLKEHEGWPPFSDFVIIRPHEPKAVSFRKASIPLLKSFLGEKALSQILDAEKDKYSAKPGQLSILSQTELEPILYNLSLIEHKDHISHHYWSASCEHIQKTDKSSGITVTIKQPEIDKK